MKQQWYRKAAALLCAAALALTAGCAAQAPQQEQPQQTGEQPSAAPETETPAPTEEPAAEAAGFTVETLAEGHGSLRSTTDEAVTEEQLKAIYKAVEAMTVGNEKMWHLTVIPTLDLIQELLPTYNEAGLIHEGNVAIIVSCTSETGTSGQYEVPDQTAVMAAGMVTQQICVAAQMQGLGFKVITDCIHESSYTLYKDNIPDEEHLLKKGMDWVSWLRQFAINKENYYVMNGSDEGIKTLDGSYVTLNNNGYTYYEQDGVTPAKKRKVDYKEGYMTPVAVVLLGNTEDEPERQTIHSQNVVTMWDGSYMPYIEDYGVSGKGAEATATPQPNS